MWSGMLHARAGAKLRFIEAKAGGLIPGLSVSRATDIYVAFEMLEVHEELVIQRGWSVADYQSCLTRSLRERPLARQ